MQSGTAYTSRSEYVFHHGVPADGEGGIFSNEVIFTIQNAGASDLVISDIFLTSGTMSDFDLDTSGTAATVAASSTTTFSVCLGPISWSAETAATATLTSNDAAQGTYTLSLRGFGIVSRFVASDGAGGHRLSCSVDLSGDTAVIGTDSANAAYFLSRNQGGTDTSPGLCLPLQALARSTYCAGTQGAGAISRKRAGRAFRLTLIEPSSAHEQVMPENPAKALPSHRSVT